MSDILNGVDRQLLFDTVDAVKADSGVAAFKFKVKNRWVDGAENRSTVDDYFGAHEELRHAPAFELVNDEPPKLLGRDSAPNPVEYILHGLAGCLTTSMVYHAAAQGIEITSVETRFEEDLDLRGFLGLDENVRNGFDEIRVVFDIQGNFEDEVKQDLIAIAQRFSPVLDIVTNGVPVTCRLADAHRNPEATAA